MNYYMSTVLAPALAVLIVSFVLFLISHGCLFVVMRWVKIKNEKLRTRLKFYFYGGMGFFVAFLCYALTVPQYTDYTTRAEVTGWLIALQPIKEDVRKRIAENHFEAAGIDFSDIVKNLNELHLAGSPHFEINEYGQMMVRGKKNGQLLVLTPYINKNTGEITWECTGGRSFDMPTPCRLPQTISSKP